MNKYSRNIFGVVTSVDKDLLGGIPYTIPIGPGGKVIYRSLGIIEPLKLKKAIVGYVGRYYK
jgi:hypothetical protein